MTNTTQPQRLEELQTILDLAKVPYAYQRSIKALCRLHTNDALDRSVIEHKIPRLDSTESVFDIDVWNDARQEQIRKIEQMKKELK